MPLVELPHSRKQVTKAGKTLRGWWQSPTLADAAVLDAIDVVSEFRKAHAYPLSMVAANLRYYVKTHCPATSSLGSA